MGDKDILAGKCLVCGRGGVVRDWPGPGFSLISLECCIGVT